MKPTIGRIVRYVIGIHENGEPVVRPAIVVHVCEAHGEDVVLLQVFTDSFDDVKYSREAAKGVFGVSLVRYNGKHQVGTWHWPE